MPKISPTAIEKLRASKATEGEMTKVTSVTKTFSTERMMILSTIPMIPPIRDINMDSIINWIVMSLRWAPMAFRMPISRVRSVTETSNDIHNADSTDQQRDSGNSSQHKGERIHDGSHYVHNIRHVDDRIL